MSLSAHAITFEPLKLWTLFLVCRYILTLSGSSLSNKVILWKSNWLNVLFYLTVTSCLYSAKTCINKKVLRERKRHTARRVVSTPSVVLTGYPPPQSWPGPGGVPCQGEHLPGGTLPGYPPILTWQGTPLAGYPLAGYPLSWPGRVPPQLDLAGYSPPRCLPHGILGNVAKHYGI